MKIFESMLCAAAAAALYGCADSAPDSGSLDTLELGATTDSLAAELVFDATELGGTTTRAMTIVNRNGPKTGPLTVTIAGAEAGDFAVAGKLDLPGRRLARGERCQLDLAFHPIAAGDRAATLSVAGSPGGRVSLGLRGHATAPPNPDQLVIALAGGGAGEVQVRSATTGEVLQTCRAGCTVPVTAGQALEVIATSASGYGGLSGACTSPEPRCTFTAAAGSSAITAAFTTDPKERWTLILATSPIQSAAYDGAGNLLVTANGITKLSPAGAVVWNNPTAACSVATGPSNTIYAQGATTVFKLDAAGALLWSKPLGPNALGCGTGEGFTHNLAVGADGAVAIHGTHGVARWDASGTPTFSIALDDTGQFGVSIDLAGTVEVGAGSQLNPEGIDLLRFAPDGTPLAPVEEFLGQYHGMFVRNPADQMFASVSGHSHVDFSGGGASGSVHLSDPDYVPNGVCSAGNGDVGWVYQHDDSAFFARDWSVRRYRAGQQAWNLTRRALPDFELGELGTIPYDIAADANGNVALVGQYNGVTFGAWIQTFAP